jgi:hypothetical protein
LGSNGPDAQRLFPLDLPSFGSIVTLKDERSKYLSFILSYEDLVLAYEIAMKLAVSDKDNTNIGGSVAKGRDDHVF